MANPPTIAISFLFFLQVLFTFCVTSYTPDDNFAVNCGSSSSSPSSLGRKWIGDIDQFSPINDLPMSAKTPFKKTPYNTARVSRSEISYLFPLKTHGQKFIRLYFYPFSYGPNFLLSDSFFSVTVGSHTLLKDFNASVTADEARKETILREYCVNICDPSEGLMITFTPSPSHQNAYAFVNGIEIVSMPTFLYYTDPGKLQGMVLNGRTQQYEIENNKALETVYRINVGGSQILPETDTGMYRYWDQDNDYLERERPLSISAGFGLHPVYRDDQNYFAPDEVYMTARNYGMKEKDKFNVTWEFEVDSDFFYMVRLHFCEFDEAIEKAGERIFQIFINDALVESVADVMLWTHSQRNVPVQRDYAASMQGKGSLKKLNLSIKLQPHPTARSTYRDVLLSGIEILKTSDFRNSLARSNPHQPLSPPLLPKAPNKNPPKIRLTSIVVGSTSGFILLSLIILLAYCRLARAATNQENSQWGPKSLATSKANTSSALPSDLCRYFSISEVRAATNNFHDSLIIGVGGFGNVYKGHIENDSVPVAIKRLKQGSQQGLKEFETEIEMLSQLRHHHLVSLIGYCNDDNEMILVYEFMAHGTFREHLYDSENQPLSWNQRLEICLGAARGLHYLHTGAKHAIIHRDVKSTNILIDENWMAKISDFGLSKMGPGGISRSNINISTLVKGSIGYMDPEYYTLQILTDKSDVFSFGVVLLEGLCGRPPILRTVDRERQNLVDWFQRFVDQNAVYETVDPFIRESIMPACLKAYTEIALKCVAKNGNERPSMGDVMLGLECLMETVNKAEKTKLGGTLNEDIIVEEGSVFDG
ncbi:receptor-like protein kinase FERONIA [Neltuma alba]|uniref:receptor-like protein kinase FERONIA n=1 Tax=Neltuma alba TaxID=207710 RepID=UPI0010A40E2E|nr:receptor-like protein kinase FERONIA [Prosopis alba]